VKSQKLWIFPLLCPILACNHTRSQAPADEVRSSDGTVVFAQNSPKLQQLRVQAATVAKIPDEVRAPGAIQPDPTRYSRLGLPGPGRVSRLLVHPGEQVKQGQTLALIDSPDADTARAGYIQAEANVSVANANLSKAESDATRVHDLFDHNAVAQKDVLAADNALAQAKAAVEQAQAALQQAKSRLAQLGISLSGELRTAMLRAPVAGKVLEINVVPGEYRTDTSAPIITVADLSRVFVVADFPESALSKLKIGFPLEMSVSAYPGETFSARVSRISDVIDPKTRTVKVYALINNKNERLRPDMFGDVRHVESVKSAVTVPQTAIIQDGERFLVYVETSPGKFQPRTVQPGTQNGKNIAIASGLQTGEQVVVDGVMLLRGQ
jgi:membrane fusion protein, heavy metal efflux system